MPIILGTIAALIGGGLYLRFIRKNAPPFEKPDPTSLILETDFPAIAERQPNGYFNLTINPPQPIQRLTVDGQPVESHQLEQTATGYTVNLVIETLHPVFEAVLQDGTRVQIAQRILPLDGGANFRDIGGYTTADGRQVKWGTVYRAGSLSNLSDADLEKIRQLNLQLVCDMRSVEEVEAAPDRQVEGASNQHFPLKSENQNLSRVRAIVMGRKQMLKLLPDLYTRLIIDRNAAVVGAVISRLANPDNLPAVVHCTAGKDRTGVTMALLLLHLGVPDEQVIADYTISNLYYENYYQFAQEAVQPLVRFGVTADNMIPLLLAESVTIETAINHVRENYGSVTDYLRDAAGVSQDDLDHLKTQLLI